MVPTPRQSQNLSAPLYLHIRCNVGDLRAVARMRSHDKVRALVGVLVAQSKRCHCSDGYDGAARRIALNVVVLLGQDGVHCGKMCAQLVTIYLFYLPILFLLERHDASDGCLLFRSEDAYQVRMPYPSFFTKANAKCAPHSVELVRVRVRTKLWHQFLYIGRDGVRTRDLRLSYDFIPTHPNKSS